MHERFQEVYRTSPAHLRYRLMEKKTRPMKEGPERRADGRSMPPAYEENRFIIEGICARACSTGGY
jgi:hypothetical protein